MSPPNAEGKIVSATQEEVISAKIVGVVTSERETCIAIPPERVIPKAIEKARELDQGRGITFIEDGGVNFKPASPLMGVTVSSEVVSL